MEYKRISRIANYSSDKCKDYLRNDFAYECAYCDLSEKFCGIFGDRAFEIDHFEPQNGKENSNAKHNYENLYYSCKTCNREKSDFWSTDLLDPCIEDIYIGGKYVFGGFEEDNFIYKYRDEKGELYVNTFKLNSRIKIEERKEITRHIKGLDTIQNLLGELKNKISKLADKESISGIEETLDSITRIKFPETSKLSSNGPLRRSLELAEKLSINIGLIIEEYNMDIVVDLDGKKIKCEIIIDNTVDDFLTKKKNIQKEKLEIWKEKLHGNYGILYCFPELERVYLLKISDIINDLDFEKINKTIQVLLTEELRIRKT